MRRCLHSKCCSQSEGSAEAKVRIASKAWLDQVDAKRGSCLVLGAIDRPYPRRLWLCKEAERPDLRLVSCHSGGTTNQRRLN